MAKFLRSYFFLILLIVIGAAIRWAYLWWPVVRYSVDECTYGIQALHILKGERPVFYYAQPFTGSQSAYLAALGFWLFGFYPIFLKLVPFTFSVVFIVATYLVASRVAERLEGIKSVEVKLAGLLAAALVAIPPVFMANWSVRAGTGYPETTLIGSLCLLVAFSILWGKGEGGGRLGRKFFLLGLLGGLGYWVQPAIAYFLVPIFGFLVVWGVDRLRRASSEGKLSVVGCQLLVFVLIALVGFGIGSLPVWVYNFQNEWMTSRSLIHKPGGTKMAFVNFFRVGLPPLLGTRAPWSDKDLFKPLAVTVWALYAAAYLGLIWRRKKVIRNYLRFDFSQAQPVDLLLACATIVPFIFSFSPFNWFLTEPRYIYGLYGSLPIILALCAVSFGIKKALVVTGLVIFSNILGIVWSGNHSRPNSFEAPLSLKNVLSFIIEHKIKYVFSSDRLCHRLIYESNEQIICTQMEGGFGSVRYPKYIEMVNNAPKEEKGYVFLIGDWSQSDVFHPALVGCEKDLTKQDGPCHEEIIDGVFRVSWFR
ncbi:MAG: hypothetical protein Q8N84_00030 [bacterium]|nr:hypothetical protein [bacterium]